MGKKIDEKKIAFIICSNNKAIMDETRIYIDNLSVPEGIEIEVRIINDAHSITEGYNRAMRNCDAKYKVYIHHDVFIVNPNFIKDLLAVFEGNKKLGMLGVIGCRKLPHNGIWWEGEGVGRTLEDNLECVRPLEMAKVDSLYELVQAVDGQLMATQYDIAWREDVCKGWHFYDTSQSLEFIRKGYQLGVVKQESHWIIHECGIDINKGYEEERLRFLEEYRNDLGGQNTSLQEEIGVLINKGEWKNARIQMDRYKTGNNIYNDTMAILEASIYLHEENKSEAFESIRKGISYNYKNYELYYMLGNYYSGKNVNQSFLCYENAEFYCHNEDKAYLTEVRNALFLLGEVKVSPVSIIILSYNGLDMTALCIDSIIQGMSEDSYELIVVDNASTDGSAEWLLEQDGLKLLCNKENNGFPAGCNQGIQLAKRGNDIFLLNNDTVVPPNAIFWLRMGLYEDVKVGATGSVSNHANNDQMIEDKKNSPEEYYQYGIERNVPMQYPYEKKVWLMGFAVMFKRNAMEQIGFLDERFTPGNYEDNDIGIRLLSAGYTQLLCKNSFIYHFGSTGFRKNQKAFSKLLRRNRKKLIEKYGMEVDTYSWVRTDLLKCIDEDRNAKFTVLDVGCGFGATMAKVESMFPNSKVWGIELNKQCAEIGKNLANIIQGDAETMELSFFMEKQLDYILLGNVLEYLKQPVKTLKRFLPYLKEKGIIILSISRAFTQDGKITTIEEKEMRELLSQCRELYFEMIEIEENKAMDYIAIGKIRI